MAPVLTSSPIASRGYRPLRGHSTPVPAARDATGEVTSHRALIALRAEARQVRAVRRFASAHLSRWGVTEDDQESVVLIVGELAGNAVQHGGADMTVSLSLTDRDLCIDVVDTGLPDHLPVPYGGGEGGEHGRGLGIVGHLANWTDFRAERGGWRSRAGLRVAPAVLATD
ncbi:anti-sigma regulatory factor (Ser/Thr protein kinase) [Streptomyces sp. SLBN-118]|uniref:ATP-binding protein n=1 Tax=Streptomyces sp. SLBN-118 TaxID=2768454 RepID=UPI001150C5F6|nr:ATP-binding protein [Streptomyces sp. SLBN-118]TQK51732.1 anti-sigma regulatory factor (Ser/Thr protein kinase) [Streptomyces sp. SLBN-118]